MTITIKELDPTPWNDKDFFKYEVTNSEKGTVRVSYDNDNVIRYLCDKGIIHFLYTDVDPACHDDDEYKCERMLGVFVNCNDVFVWACAEAQAVPNDSELGKIYELTKKYGDAAGIIWACHRRQIKPQQPMIDSLKKSGQWDETIEQYESYYERAERKKNEKS